MSQEDEDLLARFKIPVVLSVKMERKEFKEYDALIWKLKALNRYGMMGMLAREAINDLVAKYKRGEGELK